MICEVLAILAIGLVNISFVSLSGFEIQGPENETSADLFTGGGFKRGQYLKMLKDARVSYGIFRKGTPNSLIINHKKIYLTKPGSSPKWDLAAALLEALNE